MFKLKKKLLLMPTENTELSENSNTRCMCCSELATYTASNGMPFCGPTSEGGCDGVE